MENIICQLIEVIRRRSEIDREFFTLLNQDASSDDSKYIQLLNQAEQIKSDANLQKYILSDTYMGYPFFMAPVFPPIDEEILCQISLAGIMYAEYITIIEHLVDHDIPQEKIFHQTMYASFIQHKSLHLLYTLFPTDSKFWFAFADHSAQYTKTLHNEYQQRLSPEIVSAISEAAYEKICVGTLEIAKCLIDALVTFSGHLELKEPLYQVFDQIAIVIKMHDDMIDWKADFAGGRNNYLLMQFAYETKQTLDNLDVGKIKKQLYFSDAFGQQISCMKKHLDNLLQNPLVLKSLPWVAMISYHKHSLEKFEEYLELTLKRVGRSVSSWKEMPLSAEFHARESTDKT
jgi:hypothetical protein